MMKSNSYIVFPFLILLSIMTFSCKKEDKTAKEQELKLAQHQDSVYNFLTANWNLQIPDSSEELDVILEGWKPWQEFSQELNLKPVATIGAFQKRAYRLSELLQGLTYQAYPVDLNIPDIKARVALLQTSLNNLNMFLEIEPIDIDRLDSNLKETNTALRLLVDQMQENLNKATVPSEEGEAEMLEAINEERRANPTLENE